MTGSSRASLRAVTPRAGRRPAAVFGLVLLCAAVLTFGAVFYVWQRYQYIKLGFEVEALRKEKLAVEERIEPLEVESSYLSRPERIDRIAREKLGMKPPVPSQVIEIEDNGPSAQTH